MGEWRVGMVTGGGRGAGGMGGRSGASRMGVAVLWGCFRLALRRRRRGGCVDFGGVSRVPAPYRNCGGAWRGRAFGCSRFRAGFAGQRLRESLIPALAVAHQERYALLCSCLCSVRCSALLRSAGWDRRCLVAVDLVRFAAASGEVGSGGVVSVRIPSCTKQRGLWKTVGGTLFPRRRSRPASRRRANKSLCIGKTWRIVCCGAG